MCTSVHFMGDDLWAEISRHIEQDDASLPYPDRICRAGVHFIDSKWLSITVAVEDEFRVLGSSDATAARMDEVQFSIGDGPTFAARESVEAVLAEDLASFSGTWSWPLFARTAASAGVGSAFAFPLRIGAANLGVMTAYRSVTGPLSAEQFAHGLVLASIAGAEVIRHQTGHEERGEARPDPRNYEQSVVQFAAGMVAERLNTSIVDALVRMRAYAFSSDMTVTEVARLIARGRVVLDD